MGESSLKTLDRAISKAGAGSRTEAKHWIEAGRIKVNGRVVRSAEQWVDLKKDRILFDNKPLEKLNPLYLLLNKPKGYITAYKDPDGRKTVYDLIQGMPFVGTVGRLDLNTSGLLLLTNDTALADRLTDPASHVEKEYLVKAGELLTDEQLDQLRNGVELDDGPTRPAVVTRVRDAGKHTFLSITLTEGRNRQVRRMIEKIGTHVLKLVRVRIGPLQLEGLSLGAWRELTSQEVQQLKNAGKESKR